MRQIKKLDTATLLRDNANTDNKTKESSEFNIGRELQKLRKLKIKSCIVCGLQFTKLSIAKTCSNKCKCKLYYNRRKLRCH
jgi:hypothetical protein